MLGGLEQRLVELLLALAPALFDDERDLFLRHEGTLDALEARGAERLEEHVALPEEALRPGGVEDHTAVGLARDRERDPRRHVRLDHPRDHVHGGPLGREDEVDADRTRLLREADDRVLDLLWRDHHEVCELVDDHEEVGQRILAASGQHLVQLRQVPCPAIDIRS